MNYDQWAHLYDKLFPYREQTYTFLANHLPKGRVVDLACGTGTYALRFAEDGYDVTACDLSESLVDLAKEKALKMSDDIDLSVCDMRTFKPEQDRFDGAYIIGNSLVHLKDEVEVLNVLKSLKKGLKPNAKCVIQIVNYDRVLEQRIDTLPPLENDEAIMERHYRFKKGKVLFDTTLATGSDNKTHTVPLLPLRHQVLRTLLELAGFKKLAFYGNYQGDNYEQSSSFHTIVTAKA